MASKTFVPGVTVIDSPWLQDVNDFIYEADTTTLPIGSKLYNRIADTVSVKDFGAVGDGITDDAAAIQAAINSLDARGGTILFPKGTYMVSTGITLKTRAELRGSDRNNCTIRALPSATGITVLGLTGSAYNCRIRHLSIEGNDAAAKGIAILGATNGSNAHHLIEDVNASGCTVNAIHLKFIIYSRLQSVYASGGATTVLLEDMLAGSQEQCVYYNGSVQTVHMIRCSDIKAHACVYYNDVAFPATQIMLMDACWGCTNVLGTFEPQGAGCVTNTVTINDTDAGNCSDNTFLLCRFIGLTTTKTHDIAVGNSGSAFKTKLKDCQFIKPTATESIKLVNQANTEINGCVDLVTYDTPVYVEASVLNVSGNPYYKSSRIEGTGAGISNYLEGSWTPAAVCSTSGTITLTSPTDSMSYTRMGKRIFVSGRITVASVSSPVGDLSITGLPFMATNSTGGNSALAVHASSLLNTSAHTAVQAQVVQNTSAIVVRGYNGGAQVNTMSNNIQAGTTLVISGSYLIP